MTRPKQRGRTSGAPPLLLPIDRHAERPLYEQVYAGLRDAILDGRLAPGARLPSTRELAADLDISRSTVVQAFDQLRLEGYTDGRRGGGTHVREEIPDRLLRASATAIRRGHDGRRASGTAAKPGKPDALPLSGRGRLLLDTGSNFRSLAGTPAVPFELGIPATDAFPERMWARLASRLWRSGQVPLTASDPAGHPALRRAVAEYVGQARAGRCTAERVLITNGAQQALDIVARVLLDPGDAAWIEDPGYFGARLVLTAAGARLVPVPVDDEGLDVAAGERTEPDARVAYVTPSHQFPLGVVMSAPRRLELLAWAERRGTWIVEDDYDSEFRYEGRPLPCLQGLEAQRLGERESSRVLYVGTFSKTLVPGLRLGYLVVPDRLVDAFRTARAVLDGHTPAAGQAVLAEFIDEGHYTRHLRRVRALCAERQAALMDAAEAELSGLLSLEPDPAGLHVVGQLEAELLEREVVEAAASEEVVVTPLSRYYLTPSGRCPGRLLLGYAGFDSDRIRSATASLGRALKTLA